MIFSWCFHGLGHRIQVRKYRKMMFKFASYKQTNSFSARTYELTTGQNSMHVLYFRRGRDKVKNKDNISYHVKIVDIPVFKNRIITEQHRQRMSGLGGNFLFQL